MKNKKEGFGRILHIQQNYILPLSFSVSFAALTVDYKYERVIDIFRYNMMKQGGDGQNVIVA